MRKVFFIASWAVITFCLFLYSFTQVDLSLTLSRASVYQSIEKSFQYIGYFNRPLSTYLYIGIVLLMVGLYIWTLINIHKKKISRKTVWIIILITAGVLVLSYSAFSYDIFNYIFDAKIITHYHQNPYEHKALDYPGDPMLSFMHWTHRTFPYAPVWLAISVPLSYLGMGYFLVTFFLFKILAAVCFIVTSYFIEKIVRKTKHMDSLVALAFFALNPLVIIESLVSGHIDIVMMVFGVMFLYFLLINKSIKSFAALLISIGIKLATVFLLPIFIYKFVLSKRKEGKEESIILFTIILMIGAVIVSSLRTNFQPWYLLDVLPFMALLAKRSYIFYPAIIISCFSLFQYVPYLFLGNWNDPVPSILTGLIVASLVLSFLCVMFSMAVKKKNVF